MVKVNLMKPVVLQLALNAWNSGRLAAAARELGINVKRMFVFRNAPPWAKEREYIRAMSPAQLAAAAAFGEVSASTYGKPIEERIKIIREKLAGKEYEGKRWEYRVLPSGRKVPAYPRRTMYQIIKKKLEELKRAGGGGAGGGGTVKV
jgi:hypothetical protein